MENNFKINNEKVLGLFPNPTSTLSIPDALISSLKNFGKVVMHYISAISGKSYVEIIEFLGGAIYQDPNEWNEIYNEGWKLSEEYLSGDIYEKIKIAEQANKKYPGIFERNIEALKNVYIEPVDADKIHATLGSPWIPANIIDKFIVDLFGAAPDGYTCFYTKDEMRVKHDKKTGKWVVPHKNRYRNSRSSVKVDSTYGTEQLNALEIIEKTLNSQPIVIKKNPRDSRSSRETVDKVATVLALDKQQLLIKAFLDWIWQDEKRKAMLVEIYNNTYCYIINRVFDGSFLEFPGLSDNINLYTHQRNAVARILFTPNTLLAHEVGSGKTFLMIAAGMELLRTGTTKKNLYVVPNNVMVQWINDFKSAYPSANIFCINNTNFGGKKSNNTLKTIKNGNFDAIIISSSSFDKIYPSKEYYRIKEKIDAPEDMIFFDELGIDALFVDEAHNYKNLNLGISNVKILGISTNGAEKSYKMLEKVRCVQSKPNGRVIFATGTPITNSLTDLFSMQTYLQPEELNKRGLDKFNGWISMFAEIEQNIEVDVDTTKARLAFRFSKFHNLPELVKIFLQVSDFYFIDTSKNIPSFDGYTDIVIPPTEEFKSFLKWISQRIEEVRNGWVPKTEDNMLKIVGDARRAALDIRLINPDSKFTIVSKVYRCAENVFKIYQKTKSQKCTQLVFCDTSVPKNTFNIYDELKRLLTYMGIPQNEIAFIHDAQKDSERKALFKKVKKGKIRILIGSTQKLGVGVNVQDKLIALHHLDIPWRPADVIQREGRIIRQGNTNSEVQIFRYISESSFDAYSWQLLEIKQRFINRILSNTCVERSASDVDDILDYAEAKAIAVGNPHIKERVEIAIELERLMALQGSINMQRISLEKQISEIEELCLKYQKMLEENIADGYYYSETKREYSKDEKTEIEKTIFEAVKVSDMLPREKVLLNYQGFEIVIPTNMIKEKPRIILRKNGEHLIELGKTQKGIIIRIDNKLNSLLKKSENISDTINALHEKEASIKDELDNQVNYYDEIESLRERLDECDSILENS